MQSSNSLHTPPAAESTEVPRTDMVAAGKKPRSRRGALNSYETGAFSVDDLADSSPQAERVPCVVLLSGPQAGRTIEITAQTVIGRTAEANLLLEERGISRSHARLCRSTYGPVTLHDLESRNGTWCNGKRIDSSGHVLTNGDKIQIGAALLKFSYIDAIERAFQDRQYESVTRDSLTRCHNRKAFDERLPSELAFGQRHKRPVSLIMLDIDHFKKVNDCYGHLGGDEVLRRVGAILRAATRTEDVVCRYGGEEFALVLREQDADGAWMLAERLRKTIEASRIAFGELMIQVTASLGVAVWESGAADAYELVKAADDALYAAKLSGRNRVVGAAR